MAAERVFDVMVHRHVFDTDRPFARVLDGIFSGISQGNRSPGTGSTLTSPATSTRHPRKR